MSILSRSTWQRSLAEGLVIVVGVLVALAVDDWYSGLQEREQELAWLTGIRDDLMQDQMLIEAELAFLDGSRQAITEVLSTLDDPTYVVTDTAAYLRLVKRTNLTRFFRPTATTYTELTAGGGISAITNRQFMRAVIAYHQSAMLTEDLNGIVRQIRWYDWYDAITPLLDPTILAALTEDSYRQRGWWPPALSPSLPNQGFPSLTAIRTDSQFRNALGQSLDAVAVQYGNLFGMREASAALLEQVQEELATSIE